MDKSRIKTKKPSQAHPLSRSNEKMLERCENAISEFKEGKSISHEELKKKIQEGIDSGDAVNFDPMMYLKELKRRFRKE